jgi:6-phosphogluconolactonase (cycloisomerase 2 family)
MLGHRGSHNSQNQRHERAGIRTSARSDAIGRRPTSFARSVPATTTPPPSIASPPSTATPHSLPTPPVPSRARPSLNKALTGIFGRAAKLLKKPAVLLASPLRLVIRTGKRLFARYRSSKLHATTKRLTAKLKSLPPVAKTIALYQKSKTKGYTTLRYLALHAGPLTPLLRKTVYLARAVETRATKKITKTNFRRLLLLVGVVLFAVLFFATQSRAATGWVYPDGDITRWNAQSGCTTTTHWDCINDQLSGNPVNDQIDFINTTTTNTNHTAEFTMTSVAGTANPVSQVQLRVYARTAACAGTGGNNCDAIDINIRINGQLQTAVQHILTTSSTLYTATYNGSWTGDDDLQIIITRVVRGGGQSAADNIIVSAAHAEVTYEVSSELEQNSYRYFDQPTGADFEFGGSGIIQSNPTTGTDAAYAIEQDGDFIYTVGYEAVSGNSWRIEKRHKESGQLCTASACGTEFGTGGVITSSPTTGDDRAWSIAVDGDFIYIAGEQATNNKQWRIEKRDKQTGQLASGFGAGGVVTYNYGSLDDKAYAIVHDDNYLYVGGYEGIASGNTQIRIEKRNKQSGELCINSSACTSGEFGTNGFYRHNPGSATDIVTDMKLDGGRLYYTASSASLNSAVVGYLSSETGSDLSSAAFNIRQGQNDSVGYEALAVDEDYVYVAGQSGSIGNDSEQFLIKVNKDTLEFCDNSSTCDAGAFNGGEPIKINPSSADDTITTLAIEDSYIYTAGTDRSQDGGFSRWMIQKRNKTDGSLVTGFGANGTILYKPSTNHDEPRGIAIENGNMWIAGYDVQPGNYQWNIQKRKTSDGSLLSQDIAYSGSAVAAQNTAITAEEGVPFNLRASISASLGDFGANQQFKLQYAERTGLTCSLDFSAETYQDVHDATEFRTLNSIDKLADPSQLPASTALSTAFSPDGKYLTVAHATSPFITIYEIDSATNTFTKLANPASLPAGTGRGTAFSPDGKYLTVAHATSPFITIYEIDSATNTFTKLANPAQLPASIGNGAAFSPDGKYMTVSHDFSPFITIYEIDSATNTFTKLANPSVLPTASGTGTAFSPDGKYMTVSHTATPFITIYEIDSATNTFTKLANPGTLPANTAHSTAFSPDGKYMTVSHNATPFITIYEIDSATNTFTKLANPGTLPANTAYSTAFSPDGKYMTVAHDTTPFITIYEIDSATNTFTKLANPASLPAGIGRGTAFSPDGKYMSVAHNTTPFITAYEFNREGLPIQFHDNSVIPNGAAITSSSEDPNPGAGNKVMQSYVESNPFVNPNTIPNGDYGVWDFSLVNNGALPGNNYCLRIVYGAGDELDSYSVLPEITIEAVNVAPAAPTLIEPVYPAFEISMTPTFGLRTSDADSDALQYRIQVCSDSACNSIVRTIDQTTSQTGWSGQDALGNTAYVGASSVNDSTIAQHVYQAPALDPDVEYWWRAQAIDPEGSNTWSSWSSTDRFMTEMENQPPSNVILELPNDSATDVGVSPRFELLAEDPDFESVQFRIEVCSTSNCSSIVRTIDQTLSQLGWTGQDRMGGTAYFADAFLFGSTVAVHNYQAPALNYSTQYWWRAQAIDPEGSNTWSNWSSIRTFTTQAVPPPSSGTTNIQGGTTIHGGTRIGN